MYTFAVTRKSLVNYLFVLTSKNHFLSLGNKVYIPYIVNYKKLTINNKLFKFLFTYQLQINH